MNAINTGYANYYTNPAVVTTSPANFGPGQVGTGKEPNPSQNAQATAQTAQTQPTHNAGYTTPTRGHQLNISV